MTEVFIFIAGVVVTSIGYLLKRRFERSSLLEDLEIQLKLLERNRQMKEQNVSEEELEKMRQRFPTRKGDPAIKEFAEQPPEFHTQSEMYEFAENEYRLLQKELDLTIQLVSKEKSEEWKKQFDHSQLSWLEYRNNQAKLASNQAQGGTLGPFFYVTEANSLTRARIAELRMSMAPWVVRRKTLGS